MPNISALVTEDIEKAHTQKRTHIKRESERDLMRDIWCEEDRGGKDEEGGGEKCR